MALFTPSESPAVVVREIDLTGGVPNVQSTTGALVGAFQWGPVQQRVSVANEAELVDNFGSPSTSTNISFMSAAQFLRYSSSLQVVRNVADSATSAYAINVNGMTVDSQGEFIFDNPVVLNTQNFEDRESTITAAQDSDQTHKFGFVARFPGALGNSLQVALLQASKGDSYPSGWDSWTYATEFDAEPGTTYHATTKGSSNDEVHLVVIDKNGLFTGSQGTILEKYPSQSILTDAKNSEGQNIYIKDVVNTRSQYVYFVNFDSDMDAVGAGDASSLDTNYGLDSNQAGARLFTLASGVNGGSLSVANVQTGFDLFEDKDQVEIDFLIAPSFESRENQTTIVNDLVATAQSLRKDCVVVASPAREDIINVTSDATKVTNAVATANTFTASSYLVVDNNFLKIYDKYNDRYVDVPAASTVAGVMAATDINRAAWFSPAGSRRGQLLGITALNYSPTKAQRDTLYKAGINPIANIPGQGALLFGDKTKLGRPSAFDRINVRRLFLILERAIGRAAEQVLFEFNDEFTRANFVNIVEPVLREVQGRRGITDFRVVCDETNNTAEVIDRNEFKADIFIKPARSINFVTLSFVAVRTGVDFEEVVGTV